jgi:glutaredoxin 3
MNASVAAVASVAGVAPSRPRPRRASAPAPASSSSSSSTRRRPRRDRDRFRVSASSSPNDADRPGEKIGLPSPLAKVYDATGDWLIEHPAPAWLVNSPLKTWITTKLAEVWDPSYDAEKSLATVRSLIASDDVVVFSATYCPFSAAAKAALRAEGVRFSAYEWNQIEGGSGFAPALATLTGRSSIPSVWIAGEYVGGCNDGNPGIRPLIAAGLLDERLEKCSEKTKEARRAFLASKTR